VTNATLAARGPSAWMKTPMYVLGTSAELSSLVSM
jgi:hypothetical protein